MQDIRFRIAAAFILSLAAFTSIPGAVAAFFWWAVFYHRLPGIRRLKQIAFLILFIAFFAGLIELNGGGGLSYFTRMIVLILIGMWVFDEYRSGEFLNVCVWALGRRIGFDVGMMAEMGMQWLDSLALDFEQIRMAQGLKNKRGVYSLVPAGLILVHSSLRKAEDSSELLAMRGYTYGGSLCPEFNAGFRDLTGLTASIFVGFLALVPVSEFFIL